MANSKSAIVGSLLGTAVGDALGLPYEGLSRRRAARLFGPPDRYRMLPGRGMISDDTEHTCIVAQSLIAAGNDVDGFTRQIARRLRVWLLTLPAGLGIATLKACIKLCVGVPPRRSGVFSAGNGPAMRSPILGAAIDDPIFLRQLVRASTRITHTDPKAEQGALAVALAAQQASRGSVVDTQEYREALREQLAEEPAHEFLELIDRVVESHARGETTLAFAESLGLGKGVSGYVYHTVPVALHVWLSHQDDFRSAVTSVILCGGDTDSTAAIVGGIVGCATGKEGIPDDWLSGIWEWPRTIAWMENLADQLYEARLTQQPAKPPGLSVFGVLLRNVFFLVLALAHGFRRLAPPY